MKILVTGFNPFGNQPVNPAIEVVERLPDQIGGNQVIKLEIPTEFKRSAEAVYQAIKENHPDYVLNVGQAGGRQGITPERIAINLDDGRIPDNSGYQPVNQPIVKGGQTAYFAELPVKAMVKAIRNIGLPSRLSTTAGTYVCNHIMYSVQYMRATKFPYINAGFIHIPLLPSQAKGKLSGKPSLTMKQDVKGLMVAIKTIFRFNGKPDLKKIGNAYSYEK